MPKAMGKIVAFGGIDPIRHAAHTHQSCCFYSVDCSFSRKQAPNKITYLNDMTLTFLCGAVSQEDKEQGKRLK